MGARYNTWSPFVGIFTLEFKNAKAVVKYYNGEVTTPWPKFDCCDVLNSINKNTTPVLTATPSSQKVYLNGKEVAFDAYNIDDYNYFKLRDLAYVLNDTGKQFEVGWDSAKNAISLTIGKTYTAVGGEMATGDGKAKTATPTTSTIRLDGKVLDLVVYKINDNNFFKLRDLMEAIDAYVGYDNATEAITLDTSKGYSAG